METLNIARWQFGITTVTVIVVTHRPELFPSVDQRVTMVDGRLVPSAASLRAIEGP